MREAADGCRRIEAPTAPPGETIRQVANRPYWLPNLRLSCNDKIFVRVIAADQPIEMVVERVALKPQFLAEGIEPPAGAARVAVEDVDRAVVDVAALVGVIVPIGGDRRQGRRAKIVVDLARQAVVLGRARYNRGPGVTETVRL